MRGSRDFCQSYLVLSLFYSLQRGSNGFIAEKTILILYQGSRGGPLVSRGGGVSIFFQGRGPNANFFRNPCTYLLFSRGVSGPPIPLWICTWAMCRERSGSVVECLTQDRRAVCSSLTGVTALWSLSKTHLS